MASLDEEKRAHNWQWTANEEPCTAIYGEDNIRYAVWQKERSPTTGHIHWQGYLQLIEHKSLRWLQRRLGAWHFECARGSADDNKTYCTKSETRVDGPWEVGEAVAGQGARTDLATIARRIVDRHEPLRRIATSFPSQWIRYHRGIESLQCRVWENKERDFEKMVLYEGPTGQGKTHACRKLYPDAFWAWESEQAWMDRYDGETTIVLDEFMGSFPLRFMLQLCSEAPLLMPIKGGFVSCRATTVVFTSNLSIRNCYHSPAWLRRIDQYGEPGILVPRIEVLQQRELYGRMPRERSLADLAREYLPAELRGEGLSPRPAEEECIDLTSEHGDC